MKKINLVGQCFGRQNEYQRALFTIFSFLSQQKSFEHFRIVLYTDNPDYFKKKLPEDVEISYELLTKDRIKEMCGVNDFLHRMKIALIEHTFKNYNGKILYVDSDTFFVGNPQPLIEQISEGISSMHKHEYEFETLFHLKRPAGNTFIEFAELLRDNTFLSHNKQKTKIPLSASSWNAGVMIFDPSHAKFINDVYALTEQFYPPTKNHASEQYAFSILLQNNTQILPSEEYIYHYWYKIEKIIMDSYLDNLFSDVFFNLQTVKQLEKIKLITQKMPKYLNAHSLMIKDNAIQAFNSDKYKEGFSFAVRYLANKPNDITFIKDVLYHTKKKIF